MTGWLWRPSKSKWCITGSIWTTSGRRLPRSARRGGETWVGSIGLPASYLANQGQYDNAILVNPNNNEEVFVGGTASDIGDETGQIYESTDEGTTWNDISLDPVDVGPHTSQHAFVFDANGNLLVGNDVGIWRYNVNSAPVRKIDVQQHQVRFDTPDALQRHGRRGGLEDPIARPLQEPRTQIPRALMIIDVDNPRRFGVIHVFSIHVTPLRTGFPLPKDAGYTAMYPPAGRGP